MAKILKRWTLAEDIDKLYGKPLAEKARHFWRKGWEEIPESMAASPLFIVGTILSFVAYRNVSKQKDAGYQRKYREEYTVYRPNDPRVSKINTYSYLD